MTHNQLQKDTNTMNMQHHTKDELETIRWNRIDRLRVSSEDRYSRRIEKLEKKADPMIGELCRDGRTVYYVMPLGGKYRESSSQIELVDFLIRNKYVR